VLEIDSREFHFTRAQRQATMRRHNRLSAAQVSLVHYPPSRIFQGDGVWLTEVERWLRSRAAELGVAYRAGSPRRALGSERPNPLVAAGLTTGRWG
jgi:hypothetical protein